MGKPVSPKGLGSKAKAIWSETVDQYDLRVDELRVLEDACREADLVDRLETALDGADLIVKGSQGQPVANPLVQEIRQHRATLQRLLASLKLPDEPSGAEVGQRSSSARAAANARWASGA